MTYIKEQYHSNMTLAEAEKLVLQVLKNVMEEKIGKENVEVAVVRTDTRQLETRSADYVDNILRNLAWATKKSLIMLRWHSNFDK